MGHSYIEPYDPRCRGWYINAMKTPGNQFYKPYQDLFTQTTVMTGSARIDDENGNNISVISVDFIIKNLISNVFKEQDQEQLQQNVQSHSVLFHTDNNTVYYHKDWDASERTLMAWQDLEFNLTLGYYKEEEKMNFISLIEQSKNYSLNNDYDINLNVNTTPFYQFWKKNNKPQQIPYFFKSKNYFSKQLKKKFQQNNSFSLIYPIEIIGPQNVWNKTETKQQVLLIGMVREDNSQIFRALNLSNDTNYAVILSVQAFIVILIIFIITLHYGAVLKYQVDIPLDKLTHFLLQNNECSKQQTRCEEKTKRNLLNQFTQHFQQTKSITIQSKNKVNFKDQSSQPTLQTNEKLLCHNYYDQILQTPQDSFNNSKNLQRSISIIKKSSLRQRVVSNNLQKDQLQNKDFLDDFLININRNKCETQYLQNNRSKSKDVIAVNFDQTVNVSKAKHVKQYSQLDFNDKSQSAKDSILNLSLTSIANSRRSISRKDYMPNIVNIEEDIEPMFQEMQVIKDTFHKLSGVIAYKKNDVKHNESMNNNDDDVDIGSCILHYAFAAKIFKQIKNNFGLAISCLNLGYYCQKKSDYTEAIIHYQAALHHTLIDLGYQSLSQFSDCLNQGMIKVTSNQQINELIKILCGSLILQAHAIKEVIFDRRDLYRNKQVKCDFLKNEARRSRWINLAIYYIELVKKFMTQTNKSGIFILQNDTMLLVESEYIEMKMERESHVNVEILLNRFEDQFHLKQGENLQIETELNLKGQSSNSISLKVQKYEERMGAQDDKNKQMIILTLLEGRIEYLKGMLQLRKKNFKQSCNHFTQCLQQYEYLEVSLQKKAIENIGIMLIDKGMSIYNIYNEYNFLKQKLIKKVYDIAIVVEGSVGISDTFANHIFYTLLQIYSKFISKSDRTTFIAFQNQEIRIIQPLLPIDKIKQWRFCIEQIPKISTNLTQEELFTQKKKDSMFVSSAVYQSQNICKFQQKFANLQQKLEDKNKEQKHEVRQSIFIIFTNTSESNHSFTQNIKMLIANLKGQFSSAPQIIHVQLQLSQNVEEYNKTLKGIQSDSPYIIMSELQQLEYYLNLHKRSDNSQHFLTNLILTQLCK